MQIRAELPTDRAGVSAVNRAAFTTDSEARLVDMLRDEASPLISLVADDQGTIVGHILFSPATLAGHPELTIMGLAPMAVLPSCQRQGTGSALVRDGLDRCRELGAAAVVVLGHTRYYPRFGFVPASRFGLRSAYDVPDDVFMVLPLEPDAVRGRTGTIRYHGAFARL